ncbi:MAG: arginine repressor [Enterococcus sp.]
MKKIDRQKMIYELITGKKIHKQEEILLYLKEKGVHATQATISRDIRELNIVKLQDDQEQNYYALFQQHSMNQNENRLIQAIQREVLQIHQVKFMIVVLTEKHGADVVTNWLDELDYSEVVATIAGADTFIIICHTEEEAIRFAEKLEQMRNG